MGIFNEINMAMEELFAIRSEGISEREQICRNAENVKLQIKKDTQKFEDELSNTSSKRNEIVEKIGSAMSMGDFDQVTILLGELDKHEYQVKYPVTNYNQLIASI